MFETVILAGSHQTRTGGGYRLGGRGSRGIGALLGGVDREVRTQKGLEGLREDGLDERRFLKLFLSSGETVAERHRSWDTGPDPVASFREQGRKQGYNPVSTLILYPSYAPPEAEIAEVRRSLPCLNGRPFAEVQEDDRGNQYVFVRHPAYYTGLAFSSRQTTAQQGPGFLWHADGGTVILSENGERACWETRVGDEGTGKATALAKVREGRRGQEVILRYGELGLGKTYVIRPEGIDVLIGTRGTGGRTVSEQIPLLLREEDVVHVDYGRCPAGGMSDRGLGLVTQKVGIERDGKRLLTFDFGAPVPARLNPTNDRDGYLRTVLSFPPAAVFFLGQTGYRVRVEG